MKEGSDTAAGDLSEPQILQFAREPVLENILKTAQKYVSRGHFDLAIIEYQRFLQYEPNDTLVLLKLADLQAKTDQYEEAIANYEAVGRLYESECCPVKAVAVYKQLCSLIGSRAPGHKRKYCHIAGRLATLYQELGLTADALAVYNEDVSYLQQAGMWSESIAILRKMVEICGHNPLIRLRLAEVMLRENDSEGARVQLVEAAEILVGMGRREDAQKVSERFLSLFPKER